MEVVVRSSLMVYAAPRHLDPNGDGDRVLEGLFDRGPADVSLANQKRRKCLQEMMKDEGLGKPPLNGLGVVFPIDEEVLDSVPRAEAAGREPWEKALELDYMPEMHKGESSQSVMRSVSHLESIVPEAPREQRRSMRV